MSIAIQTRFIPASNHKGARIVAETMADMPPKTLGGAYKPARVYFSYDYSGNEKEHYEAAKALCVRLGWPGVYVSAGTDRGYTYARLAITLEGRLPALDPTDVAFVVSEEEAAPAVGERHKRHGVSA
jgi:hypothetical protein